MKYRLLKFLRCPECGTEFDPDIIEEEKNEIPEDIAKLIPSNIIDEWGENYRECLDKYSVDIKTALLICKNRHVYPVVNFIPRIFPGALKDFSNAFELFLEKISPENANFLREHISGNSEDFDKNFAHTQESFSAEWDALGDTDSAWGQNIAERKQMFLDCMDISEPEIKGKKILDAGCGHGEVDCALNDCGAELFAVDLSYSVDYVRKKITESAKDKGIGVHLIQANVHALPLDENIFDLVHCAGVLIHTPDTHKGFRHLTQKLKKGGKCFIEVYSTDHKNSIEYTLYFVNNLFRRISCRLPHKLLHLICWTGAPFLWLYVELFNILKGTRRYHKRSLQEMELSLFDSWSPRYQWHHKTEEVMQWFNEHGYKDLKKSFANHNGIGVVGTLNKK